MDKTGMQDQLGPAVSWQLAGRRGEGVIVCADGHVIFIDPQAEQLLAGTGSRPIARDEVTRDWSLMYAGWVENGSGSGWRRVPERGETDPLEVRRRSGRAGDGNVTVWHVRTPPVAESVRFFEIITGATSGAVGDAFCEGLVRQIGPVLGCQRLVVARLTNATEMRCRTVVAWSDGRLEPTSEFVVAPESGTYRVLRDGVFETWGNLPELFPASAAQASDPEPASVVSVALSTAGGVCSGYISAFFAPGVTRKPDVLLWLRLFATRVAAELEREDTLIALRESEQRTRTVLEHLDAGVVVVANDALRYANPEAARLLGFEDAATLLARAKEALPPMTWQRLISTPPPVEDGMTATITLVRRDGTSFEADVSRARWPAEGPAASQIVFRDVTARQRFGEAIETVSRATGGLVGLEFLRQFVRELGRILNARRIVVIEFLTADFSRARHVAAWNQEEAVALAEYEVLPDSVTTAIRKLGRVEQWGGMAGRFPSSKDWHEKRGTTSVVGSSFFSASGEVQGHLSATFGPEVARMAHAGPIVDLFAARVGAELDRMRQEKLNRQLAVQLEAAQRMEALGRLAGGVAHDFNNVLTSIMGNLEIAMLDTPAGSDLRGLLREAMGGAKRARDVVAQLLTFAQRRAPRVVPTALAGVVGEACRLMKAALPPDVRLELDAPPNLPAVCCDPTNIHQVVVNLCTNAVHAMSETGGRISVTLRDGAWISRTDGAHPALCIEVQDTGSGMAPAVRERLFEPFFTTKAKGRGSGLGLATVHGIVGSLRGTIEVDSAFGQGTTFRVLLPTCGEAPVGDADPTGVLITPARKRIAIVDDEAAVLRVLCRFVREIGIEAVAYGDPLEAVDLIGADSTIDGLLADYAMPGLDGLGLIARVKQARPDLPCWLISGNASSENLQAALALGVEATLEKPIELATLARALLAVFQADGSL